MSEWVSAAIGAGSAVFGGVVTGWFTRSAGHRQADAAAHAGNRQADALIATVQVTLDEQRDARALDRRREAYAQFLDAMQSLHLGASSEPADLLGASHARNLVILEGPPSVTDAAHKYFYAVAAELRSGDDEGAADATYKAFMQAATAALRES
ncbi:hypothetical protein OG693_39415 (plasmid) [Streptomyces sp. NBC_01259]|uniref:hypothetical protein n=1 Tax=Streptomyces sp. NBC_01259 TaxID=2903800 RepID=UPI002F912E6F